MTNANQDASTSTIQCITVPSNCMLPILPKYFPNLFLIVENTVYSFAERLCESYFGGFWKFHELSNGGFYMSLDSDETHEVVVPFGNGYSGSMSSDALGICVCLFVYSFLAEKFPSANFVEHYWHLRNFAYDHSEAQSIFKAID